MRRILLGIFLTIIAVSPALADWNSCAVGKGGGAYDTMVNSFFSIAETWNTTLLPKAKYLFWGFFAAEFLYQVTFKKILGGDYSKLYIFFVTRIFTAYVFAQIFLDIDFYTGIIQYFTNLGAALGGTKMSVTSNASGMGVTPSSLLGFLECKFSAVLYVLMGSGAVVGYFVPIFADFAAIVLSMLIVLLNIIPIMLTLVMVDAYVVLFAGFILAGFSGSSWTQSYWQKYLSYVFGIAIRLFMTCLMSGLIVKSLMSLPFNVAHPLDSLFALFGIMLLNVYLLLTIPSKAASMLTGSIAGGMGEIVGAASMLMASMGAGAALSKAGGAAMSGISGASGAGKSAAISRARELLGGGAGGAGNSIGAGNASQWKSAVKSEAGAAGKSAAMSSIKDGFSEAGKALRGGSGTGGTNNGGGGAAKKFGETAKQAGKMGGSGHSGGAELNINPHKE